MSSETAPSRVTSPLIPNRVYDILKFVALVFLPALGSLYFGLSQIWGFPNGEEVVGTIALLGAFLGSLLKLSDRQYNNSDARYDGDLVISKTESGDESWSFELNAFPEDLSSKKELMFKVRPPA